MDIENKTACGGCDLCAVRAELTAALETARALDLAPPPDSLGDAAPSSQVVDVRFRDGGKIYYFDPNGLDPHPGDGVILDTARGPEYGVCANGVHSVDPADIVTPLRRVLRLATERDNAIVQGNHEKEKRAFSVCQERINELRLDMQLVSAECAFDGSKLLFFFTADGRVDFRELVKNLAATFRTRIELRQIGVRDKAKMVGGIGVCGKEFCCTQFMSEFQPVSIKMAKTQNLSLNPGKISGACGRLMCCLKYEQAAYEDLLSQAPRDESLVDTPSGRGTVCDVNLLRQTVRVRLEDKPDEIVSYRSDEIAVLRSGRARKGDAPIPKDLAPISGSAAVKPKPVQRPAPQEDNMSQLFRKLDDYADTKERRHSRRRKTDAPEQPSRESKPRTGSRRRRSHRPRRSENG